MTNPPPQLTRASENPTLPLPPLRDLSPLAETPRPLLDQIHEGKNLLHVSGHLITDDAGDSETFARGALLNELRKGKELRVAAPSPEDVRSQTMARGGLLHELQTKTVPSIPAAEGAGQIVDPLSRVSKEGWLLKRASNGVWQKRYFILTPASLCYYSTKPKNASPSRVKPLWSGDGSGKRNSEDSSRRERESKGGGGGGGEGSSKSVMPVVELRDVHPTGMGGEFSLLHVDRLVRLRAESAVEAGRWVEALVTQQLESGRHQDMELDASGVLEGLVSPQLLLFARLPTGELLERCSLGDCLQEMAEQIREGPEVKATLKRICEEASDIAAGEPELPLPRGLREWGLPNCKLLSLLRWMHPSVLKPLSTTLIENLASKMTLDLDKASWQVKLEFEPGPAGAGFDVTLRHWLWWDATIRRSNPVDGRSSAVEAANSQTSDEEATKLRFKLQLVLSFLPNSVEEISRCELHVIDYEFEPCSRLAKEEGKTALKPLCLPHLEYYQIWKRPLQRLPVHKDVPRLLKGMQVSTTGGRVLYREEGTARLADPANQVVALRSLMLALATELDPPGLPAFIEEKFSSFLGRGTTDVAEALRSFLLESGLPDYAVCVQVLKCIHQEIIFPAVSSLHNSIYTLLPYKDMKGEWKVTVDIGLDSVKVTHRRWEVTQDNEDSAFFKFYWVLTLLFDRRMRHLAETGVAVQDFEFGPSTSEERKRVVAAVLKPWLGPGVLYKRMWAMVS